jgi:DNA-binding response OmpR family regulator
MRILVVEDEHKIAQAIKKGLEQEAYAVDLAFDGQDGLDLALSDEFDLIILDRMLPEIDGLEICKRVRGKNIHTPILILTAKGQISDRVEGLDAGADDYLPKPFAFEELLARIRSLLRRPKETLSTVLKVANLSLDTTSFEVKRDGKKINLSNKEFALLEYLIRNSGKILTKDQIINHVWNYEADVYTNTVEVYIGYLRNKIDKGFGKPLIQTRRGFGYLIGEG